MGTRVHYAAEVKWKVVETMLVKVLVQQVDQQNK
jgi:hypothetical protein